MKEFDLAGLHEDHSLKAQVAPPLSELCVRIIAQNFSNRPTLRGIPTRFVDRVTELLPTTLPLERQYATYRPSLSAAPCTADGSSDPSATSRPSISPMRSKSSRPT